MTRRTPRPTLFPYTTLFRSLDLHRFGDQLLLHDVGLDFVALVGLRLLPLDCFLISGSLEDRKSTRLNSSHVEISYAVFCLKKKKVLTFNPQLHAILRETMYS